MNSFHNKLYRINRVIFRLKKLIKKNDKIIEKCNLTIPRIPYRIHETIIDD
jgi:hypothetical protein